MANCLVTKLKANVIDDTLNKVNTMTIRIKESGIGAYRMFNVYTIGKARLVKGNLYSDDGGTSIAFAEGSEFQSSGVVYVGVDEETIIEIINYHTIVTMQSQSSSTTINGKPINIEDLGFSPTAISYMFRFVSSCSGSVEKIAERLFSVRNFAGASQNICSIDARNNDVKFNGVVPQKQLTIKMIEGSLTIHDGLGATGATLATYNEGTKTWSYMS